MRQSQAEIVAGPGVVRVGLGNVLEQALGFRPHLSLSRQYQGLGVIGDDFGMLVADLHGLSVSSQRPFEFADGQVGAPQQHPAVDVVGVRLEPFQQPRHQLHDLATVQLALAGGDFGCDVAPGEGLAGHLRRAEGEIDPERGGRNRHRQDGGRHAALGQGGAGGGFFFRFRSRQHAALDLDPGRFGFLIIHQPPVPVSVDFPELVLVDGDVVFAATGLRSAGAADQRHHNRQRDNGRHQDAGDPKPGHGPSSFSSFRSFFFSSSVSGGGLGRDAALAMAAWALPPCPPPWPL